MANGYEDSDHGTDRLWCGPPKGSGPDEVDSGDSPDLGAPNCAAGNFDLRSSMIWASRITGNDDTHDFFLVGDGDFSLEFWIKRQFPDSITDWQTAAAAATGYCVSGLASETGASGSAGNQVYVAGTAGTDRGAGAGIQCRGANFEAFYQDNDEAGGITFTARTFTLPFGWHHVAVVYDYDGNMETFVDGTSAGTDALPQTGTAFRNTDAIAQYCNITDQAAASGKAECPYLLAGMAYHTAVLTDAQVLNSVKNLGLQTLGATTAFAFFYKDIELLTSSWSHDGVSPTSQSATRARYTTTLRSELSTIVADLRDQVVEVTAANTDTDNGGVAGAVQVPDLTSTSDPFTWSDSPNTYAVIKNLNTGSSATDLGIGILGIGNVEQDETNSTFYSPALLYDPSWPPKGGVGGSGSYA